MLHFAGGIPKPLLDQTWERTGGPQLIRQLDERYLSEEVRLYGGNIAVGAQMIFQQKLIFKAEF